MRWKKTSPLAVPEAGYGATTLHGFPWLPEKHELPFLWRYVWPWHVFLVKQRADAYYFGYFRTGTFAMVTTDSVRTPYVAVRIGPQDTDFAFTDFPNGSVLKVELQTPVQPLKRKGVNKSLKGNITFI